MDVNSISQFTPTASAAGSRESASTVGYDNFLKLLLAQMKNQDPTEPMKSTDYMAQLATFSQVEQTVKSNSKLDALLSSFVLSQADDVIGRTVTSADGTTTGAVSSVRVTEEGAIAYLSNGEELRLGTGIVIR